MANKNKKTADILLSHSKAKVQLLGEYMKRYLPIIQQAGYAEAIQVFDLFCERGVYKNQGKGSPIIFLESVKDLFKNNKGRISKWIPFRFIFNDWKEDKITQLRDHVIRLGLDKLPHTDIVYRSKDYTKIVSSIPDYMRGLPKHEFFVFIDPHGYSEVHAQDIKNLLDTKRCEVLIWQPVNNQYRPLRGEKPEALEKFVGDVLPGHSLEFDNQFAFIEAVRNGFRKYVGSEFYVDTFTIQKDSSTVYALYFFTKHIRGYEKMLEAKWEMDKDRGKGWKYETTFDLFAQDTEANEFEVALKAYLKKVRSNKELYTFTLDQEHLPKHCTEILRHLQDKGQLSAKDSSGKHLRTNAFYVNYDNYKQQNVKGFFQLK